MGKILILTALLAIAGCQTSGGSFCAISKPIRPSAETVEKLSDAEVQAILEHNEKGRALCSWRR